MSERLETSSGKEGARDDQSDVSRILSPNSALQGFLLKDYLESIMTEIKLLFFLSWNR